MTHLLLAVAVLTMRVDYYHTGNAAEERFSLDRVVIEPLPWAGNPAKPIDDTNLGKYRFTVVDLASGKTLFSRGFASIYGEWETTAEAKTLNRTFSESLRFPVPATTVRITLEKRDKKNQFQEIGTFTVDPADKFVARGTAAPDVGPLIKLHEAGDPAAKLDLLILGDGYTAKEVGSSRVDLQACKLEYSIVSPK